MENSIDILNELKELSPTVAAIEKVNVFRVPQGYFEYLETDIMLGIGPENGLSHAAVSIADVPGGYFENLSDAVLNKIKAQDKENDILPAALINLAGKNVYEVPQDYFDQLPGAILSKITATAEDAATEIRTLSPMLYSVQNENVFSVPQGYFENLSDKVLDKVKPQTPVVSMQRRSSIFKYAVAAAFTGVMALGVFKFTAPTEKIELPGYVTLGKQIKDVDQELAKISDADIVKYLEANGTDVKTAMVANSIDENELPSQEDYLLDEKALDKYLNTINIDGLKN